MVALFRCDLGGEAVGFNAHISQYVCNILIINKIKHFLKKKRQKYLIN